jgi:hypothetical protein
VTWTCSGSDCPSRAASSSALPSACGAVVTRSASATPAIPSFSTSSARASCAVRSSGDSPPWVHVLSCSTSVDAARLLLAAADRSWLEIAHHARDDDSRDRVHWRGLTHGQHGFGSEWLITEAVELSHLDLRTRRAPRFICTKTKVNKYDNKAQYRMTRSLSQYHHLCTRRLSMETTTRKVKRSFIAPRASCTPHTTAQWSQD